MCAECWHRVLADAGCGGCICWLRAAAAADAMQATSPKQGAVARRKRWDMKDAMVCGSAICSMHDRD